MLVLDVLPGYSVDIPFSFFDPEKGHLSLYIFDQQKRCKPVYYECLCKAKCHPATAYQLKHMELFAACLHYLFLLFTSTTVRNDYQYWQCM